MRLYEYLIPQCETASACFEYQYMAAAGTCYSYGGFSVGERNDLVPTNSSQIAASIERILRAANGNEDPNIDVTLPPIVENFQALLENFATRQNAKVSRQGQ